MSLVGTRIRLKGTTVKGKNRIRENGDVWMVLAETDRVLFARDQPGPWLWIVADGKAHDDKSTRWVHATSDKDFVRVALDA